MPPLKLVMLLILCASSSVFAQGKLSVAISKDPNDANIEVTVSDSYLGFGDTVYLADSYPGFGDTFYITDNKSSADIAFVNPETPGDPNSADVILYVHKRYPGFGDTVYLADSYPGFGKTIYIAKNNPGFGTAIYVEDPILRFNKKILAILLLKLGQI